MCTYQTLGFDEKYGYIIYCNQCHSIQFAFGCFLINFHQEQFRGFKRVIDEIAMDYYGTPDSHVKSIYIPTPCEEIVLYLSLTELRLMRQMAETAETNLSANALVALFSAPM